MPGTTPPDPWVIAQVAAALVDILDNAVNNGLVLDRAASTQLANARKKIELLRSAGFDL